MVRLGRDARRRERREVDAPSFDEREAEIPPLEEMKDGASAKWEPSPASCFPNPISEGAFRKKGGRGGRQVGCSVPTRRRGRGRRAPRRRPSAENLPGDFLRRRQQRRRSGAGAPAPGRGGREGIEPRPRERKDGCREFRLDAPSAGRTSAKRVIVSGPSIRSSSRAPILSRTGSASWERNDPQIFGRGKRAFSSTTTLAPARERAPRPRGPARLPPTTATSNSALTGGSRRDARRTARRTRATRPGGRGRRGAPSRRGCRPAGRALAVEGRDPGPEGERPDDGDESEGDAVPRQVEGDDGAPRHALRLAEERRDLGRREVVKEQRREDDVDAPVREGEGEGVGGGGAAPGREAGVRQLQVETERAEGPPRRANAERRSRPTCPEPQPRSSSERLPPLPASVRQEREEPPREEDPPTEVPVDPLDVREARLGLGSGHVAVEDLFGRPAAGNPEAHRGIARPFRTTRAVFFDPKAIPFTTANSTSASRGTFGT